MELASGHKVEELEEEELAKQMKDWKGYTNGLVRLTPGPWIFSKGFLKFADNYYKFKFRESDVVIATYPKCGTTWTQEIVWTMRNNPDLTNPSAKLPILARSPFMEFDLFFGDKIDSSKDEEIPFKEPFDVICPGRKPEDGVCLQIAECIPDPRTIKTHLPFSLLPPSLLDTCKVIYVARNPKDVLVSYHHHCRLFNPHGYVGTWEDFVNYFVNDDLMYGAYGQHVREAWALRNHPNMHLIFYEDLKANVMRELKRLDNFLGTKLTPQQLENVARQSSFSEMKKNDELLGGSEAIAMFDQETHKKHGGFFRKGETGDWKNKISPELMTKVDEWIEKNFGDIDLSFKYSI